MAEELNVDERRKAILGLLKQSEKVRINDLKERFNTSDVTIRTDLKELEKQGMLRRIHGGALSTQKAYFNMSLNDRMNTNKEEKIRIARAITSFVSEGDTLMMDTGTTTYYIARELLRMHNLTIVTNSILIAQELSNHNHINMILLGGNLDPKYLFTYGDDALNQLRKYKADKMIVATDGITADKGVTTNHHLEAEVNLQMIKRSKQTIAVADFSKVGKEGFAYIDSLDSIDILITNKNADQAEIAAIADKGVFVEQV